MSSWFEEWFDILLFDYYVLVTAEVYMQVIVLGACRAGIHLVRRLLAAGHEVVLVDPNAEEIASKKSIGVVAVTGVIIDIDVLREASIESADALCAMSESENQNLMASQIAREIFNVKHVITRVYDISGLPIFNRSGFVAISSTDVTCDAVMRELEDREIESSLDYSMHHIMGTSINFTLLNADKLVGAHIKDVKDTDARHIFAIVRNDIMILAQPEMRIEKGDKLILAAM